MPKLITGDCLSSATCKQVLASFGYRWTKQNERRARMWQGKGTPTIPLQDDKDWLKEHAFYVNKDGCLSKSPGYCEPAYMAKG